MAIWLIQRTDDGCGYEEFCVFVVRAPDEITARQLAASQDGRFAEPDFATCSVIDAAGDPAIILYDFHHG